VSTLAGFARVTRDMRAPRVSVLMSVYNGERYLRGALDSICQQSLRDLESVIVDDGSTDATWSILESYARLDARLVLIQNQRNIGLSRSLNRGLNLARARYVARMDADDVSLPERLRAQADFLDAHPDVGVLGCAVQVIDACGNPQFVRRFPAEHGVLRWRLCFQSPIVHPTAMMRRDVLRQVGGYDPHLPVAQDYDLWERLICTTRLANLPEVLLCFRKHPESVEGRRHAEQRLRGIEISRRVMSRILGEEPPIDAVQCLWQKDPGSGGQLRQTAGLVARLCLAFLEDNALSVSEKQIVRREAAARLWRLARLRVWCPEAWQVALSSLRVDPLEAGREETRRVWHPIRKALLAARKLSARRLREADPCTS